jgi:tRNA dimethylallyltransferase
VGKTDLSLAVGQEFSCEIINMDSMQIYRHMNIGTAKPSLEERKKIPHHLLDYVDPDEDYNVAHFVADAGQAIADISDRGKIPLLIGGTGLYLQGLLEGVFSMPPVAEEIKQQVKKELAEKGGTVLHAELAEIDPASSRRIHPHDSQRICRALEIYRATAIPWSTHLRRQQEERQHNTSDFQALKIGLQREREILYQRINKRTRIMMEQGLVDEVKNLLAKGYSHKLNAMQAIGYKHMVKYIRGEWSREKTETLLARDTRRYAKRQITWFRRDKDIHWFEPEDLKAIRALITRWLSAG